VSARECEVPAAARAAARGLRGVEHKTSCVGPLVTFDPEVVVNSSMALWKALDELFRVSTSIVIVAVRC
jgi:hypothetical protein